MINIIKLPYLKSVFPFRENERRLLVYIYINYRDLNNITIKNRYLLYKIFDSLNTIRIVTYFN